MVKQQQAAHEMAPQSPLRGLSLVDIPNLNKGTAFTAEQVCPGLRDKGMLFPSQANIFETAATTVTRVAGFMFDKVLAQVNLS